MKKCRAKDCKRRIDDDCIYCSFECAMYDETFNIKTGWNNKLIKKKYPKEIKCDKNKE